MQLTMFLEYFYQKKEENVSNQLWYMQLLTDCCADNILVKSSDNEHIMCVYKL